MADPDVQAVKDGATLLGKLCGAAADEDVSATTDAMVLESHIVIEAALILAAKLISEEVPLVRVASLLATAESYQGIV